MTLIPIFVIALTFSIIYISEPAFGQTANEIDMAVGAGASATADCVSVNNCFSPNPMNVQLGATVTWVNNDQVGHTITSGKPGDDNMGSLFNSDLIKSGNTFQFTFANAGIYDYFCSIHPWMTGQVIVSAATTGGTTGGSQTGGTSTAENSSNNSPLSYAVFFITENDTCTDSEYKSLKFYQVIADEYLTLYKIPHDLEGSLCVPLKNYQTYFSGLSTFTLPIVIADNTVGQQLVQQGYYGLYEISGTGRQAVYVCSCDSDIESWTGAWVLSHELSHFALHYLGEPDTISVDWVHYIQALVNSCEEAASSKSCQAYSTIVTSPSGNQIPVMEIFGQDSTSYKIPSNQLQSEITIMSKHSASNTYSLQVGSQNYLISYGIIGGTVKNMTPDPESLSLVIKTKAQSDGSLTLILPRELLDAKKNDGTDDIFIVLVNGMPVTYTETNTNSISRTLLVSFKSGDGDIEITGTHLGSNQLSPQLTPSSQVPMKTYLNHEYNFSIPYPSGWTVHENYVSGNGNVGIVQFQSDPSEESYLSVNGKVENVQLTGNQYLNKIVQDDKDFCSSFTFERDQYTCEFNLANATFHQYNGLTHYIVLATQSWKASPNSNGHDHFEFLMDDNIAKGNDRWKLYGSVNFNDSSSDTVKKVTDHVLTIYQSFSSFTILETNQSAHTLVPQAFVSATPQDIVNISEAKNDKTIAAEVNIGANQSTTTIDNNVLVQTTQNTPDSLGVKVSATNQTGPKVIAFNLAVTTINVQNLKDLGVMYDGKPISPAPNMDAILHAKSTDNPSFAIVVTQSGVQVLVLVPHFSTHSITITNMSKVIPAVPEFPFAAIVFMIAIFSIILIPKIRHFRTSP